MRSDVIRKISTMFCRLLCLATFFAGVSQAQVLERIIEDRRLEGAAIVRREKARLGTRRPEMDTDVRTETATRTTRRVVRVGKFDDEAKRIAREKSREIQNEKAQVAKRIAREEEKHRKQEAQVAKRIAREKAAAKHRKEEAKRLAREKAKAEAKQAEEAKRIARATAEEEHRKEEAKRIAREKAEAEERIVEKNKTKTDNPDFTVEVTDSESLQVVAEKTKRPVKFKGTPVSNAITSGEEPDSIGFDSTHVLFLGGAIGFACIVIVFVLKRRRADSKNEDEDKSGGDRTDSAVVPSQSESFRGSNDSSKIYEVISNIPTEVKTTVSTIRPSHSASAVYEKQLKMAI